MILCFIEGCKGDAKIKGYPDYFTLTSFSFKVERELKDSNKAGTEDVNIGVAEMQECTIGKSMDRASIDLAKKAISGSSVKCVEIKFLQTFNEKNIVYLQFKLDNAFVKTWNISGDADDRPSEEITLWYNKIAFCYFPTSDGTTFGQYSDCAWDASKGTVWKEPGLDKTPAGA